MRPNVKCGSWSDHTARVLIGYRLHAVASCATTGGLSERGVRHNDRCFQVFFMQQTFGFTAVASIVGCLSVTISQLTCCERPDMRHVLCGLLSQLGVTTPAQPEMGQCCLCDWSIIKINDCDPQPFTTVTVHVRKWNDRSKLPVK